MGHHQAQCALHLTISRKNCLLTTVTSRTARDHSAHEDNFRIKVMLNGSFIGFVFSEFVLSDIYFMFPSENWPKDVSFFYLHLCRTINFQYLYWMMGYFIYLFLLMNHLCILVRPQLGHAQCHPFLVTATRCVLLMYIILIEFISYACVSTDDKLSLSIFCFRSVIGLTERGGESTTGQETFSTRILNMSSNRHTIKSVSTTILSFMLRIVLQSSVQLLASTQVFKMRSYSTKSW